MNWSTTIAILNLIHAGTLVLTEILVGIKCQEK
jgi:hypothetical protein